MIIKNIADNILKIRLEKKNLGSIFLSKACKKFKRIKKKLKILLNNNYKLKNDS